MEDETIENIDSKNDAEINNDNVELENDDAPTIEDFMSLKEKAEKLEATNKKLYSRLKSSENKTPLKNKPQIESEVDYDKKIERLELKTEGYNEEEIEFLTQYGGKKALENSVVKTALEVLREKQKSEKAAVDSDNSGSDLEKKYTTEQLRNMKTDELEALIKSSTNR